jgi:uncharacterized protein (DUF433 family)
MTIVRDPGVRSGDPVVEGTRITVGDVAERFYKLGRSSSSIASDLGISEEEVEEALRYYHDQIVEKEKGSAAEA